MFDDLTSTVSGHQGNFFTGTGDNVGWTWMTAEDTATTTAAELRTSSDEASSTVWIMLLNVAIGHQCSFSGADGEVGWTWATAEDTTTTTTAELRTSSDEASSTVWIVVLSVK